MAGWDAYLAVEGVESESQREGHEGEIEVLAFQFGGSNISSVGQGSGGGTGVVALSEFMVQKKTDASSADMFQQLCTGEHYPTAKLTLYKSGGDRRAAGLPRVRLRGGLRDQHQLVRRGGR